MASNARESSTSELPQPSGSANRGKRKSYDTAFKLKVIEQAEICNNREASRKFGVGESSIRDWRKQRNQLKELPSKRLRLTGGGRKAQAPDMEEELSAWIDSQRSLHIRVTRSAIQLKARELYEGEEEFSASRGWLEKFLKRKGFSLRRTTVSQRLPEDSLSKVSSFILRIRKLKTDNQ